MSREEFVQAFIEHFIMSGGFSDIATDKAEEVADMVEEAQLPFDENQIAFGVEEALSQG